MAEYFVRHRTTYRYQQDVSHSWHLAHLQLRTTPFQAVHDSSVTLSLEAASTESRRDYFGNPCDWFSIDQPHTHLEILAESHVRVAPRPERISRDSLSWENVRALLESPSTDEARGAVQFIFDSPMTKFESDIAGYAEVSFPPGRPLLAGAMELMNRIHKDFRYDTSVTDATTPVDRVFEIRAGVCQDLAHVAIAAMRSIGLPARYVSGYLLTQPPPGQPRLLGADASHAWFSVWAPPFGWVDLDPTNNVVVSDAHVTAAWGRDYGDVSPVGGIILGGHDHVVDVGVDVIPMEQMPGGQAGDQMPVAPPQPPR
ncbi:MAG TPA: transglutaminase family protein [Rhizomicrobium sp.]|jgi:transglutaminase-like putative cysteine protease|nr:transglutaminase family protein [Rhizomicrobium sp.]